MNKRQRRHRTKPPPLRAVLDRVQSSLKQSFYIRLRELSEVAEVNPSAMIRELLEGAAIRLPERTKTFYILLPSGLMAHYRRASDRTRVPVAALVRATLEHEIRRLG